MNCFSAAIKIRLRQQPKTDSVSQGRPTVTRRQAIAFHNKMSDSFWMVICLVYRKSGTQFCEAAVVQSRVTAVNCRRKNNPVNCFSAAIKIRLRQQPKTDSVSQGRPTVTRRQAIAFHNKMSDSFWMVICLVYRKSGTQFCEAAVVQSRVTAVNCRRKNNPENCFSAAIKIRLRQQPRTD